MSRLDLQRILMGGAAVFLCLSGGPLALASSSEESADRDSAYWFFQPIGQPEVPEVKDVEWVRNPIDAFVLARLETEDMAPAREAGRRTLIRRASLDLLGVPPTPQEIDRFLNDPAPNAYERLIDRLLASPRYGERYARHWLDLVRYADSDGFKSDVLRPHAWRYRDYVIESFNEDKRFSRFVEEQIAGDELYPGDDDAKRATGYLRLWPYEDNQPDMGRHWEATLDDITDVSGDVFLGLSMKCARCHDHKFDPISQKDYYSLRAFFGALSPWEDIRLGDEKAMSTYLEEKSAWESITAGIRTEMDTVQAESWEAQWALARGKLPPYMHDILDKTDRTPYEEQLARFGLKMITYRTERAYKGGMKGDKKKRWYELEKELTAYSDQKPRELPRVAAVRDIGGLAPRMYVGGAEGSQPVEPGYLAVLGQGDAKIDRIEGNSNTTGRRAALARWLTDEENPLSVRVIANRLWQWHFGKGIVASSNDFGLLGEQPTHPDLLDWLARRFVAEGWSMKAMHRLIMTSATYRQASRHFNARGAAKVDAENRLLWRMPARRMDAEQIRDSMLFVSGELDLKMGGPAVAEEKSTRRAIYVQNKRNKLMTTMNVFDTPDLHNSCALRDVTTTPIQALALLNGDWTVSRAERFAALVSCEEGIEQRIQMAYRRALGRMATDREVLDACAFLDQTRSQGIGLEDAWTDFCHILLNTNEFLYIH